MINQSTLVIKIDSESIKKRKLIENLNVKNYIFDISNLDESQQIKIKEKLTIFGSMVINNGYSFVIVSRYLKMLDYNVVPTVQEAHDIIELEEIERDLLKN